MDNVGPTLKKFLHVDDPTKDLLAALAGYDTHLNVVPLEIRRETFLKLFIEMCIPALNDKIKLLMGLMNFGYKLVETKGNKEVILKELPLLADDLSTLMGLNPKVVKGILGIMQGDMEAFIFVVAPLCKMDVKQLQKIVKVFFGGQISLDKISVDTSSADKVLDDATRTNMLSLGRKAADGVAGIRELFQLVSAEATEGEGVTVAQFSRVMGKLNMPMTGHRVLEVFSRCKSKFSKFQDILDEDGNINC
jgi:hypothetical protein